MKKSLCLLLIAFLVLGSVACTGKDEEKNNAKSKAETLFALKNANIGDAKGDEKLLSALQLETLGAYTIELQSQRKPYSLTVNFRETNQPAASLHSKMKIYAPILLALIDNAGEIRWRADRKGAKKINNMDVEEATRIYGAIKAFGVTAQKLDTLLQTCGYYAQQGRTTETGRYIPGYYALEAKKVQLRQQLGKHSIFPEFYTAVREYQLMGKSEEKALADGKAELIQREALYLYAVKEHQTLSAAAVKRKMKQMITEAKSADGYAAVKEDCKQAGIAFQALMQSDQIILQRQYSIDAALQQLEERYLYDATKASETKDWPSQKEKMTAKLVADYKKTEDFRLLDKAISAATDLIKRDTTDLAQIKAKDVSVYNKLTY